MWKETMKPQDCKSGLKKRQILVPSDAIWLPAALLSDFPAGGIYKAILRIARGVY
jgi:hypothetical protein